MSSSFLRDSCPDGLYLSLTPGDPSLWTGVLFVRKGTVIPLITTSFDLHAWTDLRIVGPYAGAVLRLQISFPDTYPDLPPLITLSSDIFHPLVVPLTTYTFSAIAADASGTASASDEGHLPPGSFSLRYGFPAWFQPRSTVTKSDIVGATQNSEARPSTPCGSDPGSEIAAQNAAVGGEAQDRKSLLVKVLCHIQDAFENEEMLDSMPLSAAGDPSAWHAWRAHRGLAKQETQPKSTALEGNDAAPSSPKHPGEWKWDGVWESRVNNGIEASVSEAALFGSTGGGRAGSAAPDMASTDPRQRRLATADRQIRFSKVDDDRFDELKGEMSITVSTIPP